MAFSKDINELVAEDTSGLLSKHESWERVSLRDIVEVLNGYAFSSTGFNTGSGLPLIRIRDIALGQTNTTYEGTFADEYIVNHGDLLIGMDGDFNSAFWRSGKALLNQRVCKLTANGSFYNQKFLAYLLPGYLDAIHQNTSAVTVKHLSSKTIQSIPLPLPARKEQNRLVEKIDELFSEFDSGVKELKAAKIKLSQYRQSLLKSAVEGSLTQQWRKANNDSIQETGEQLLERILIERRECWEKQKLAEFQTKDKKPPKNWQDKYPEPVLPATKDLPELPEGWVWATIEQLAVNKRYGSSSKTNDDSSGVPVLRMGNIQDGKLDYGNLKYLPVDHKEFPDLLLNDGDLLFNRTNSAELVGKTAIYRDIGKPVSYASYLISVAFTEHFLPEIAAHYINSVLGKKWLAEVMNQTAGQANVNGSKLGSLAIPLPSTAEQKALIDEISNKFDAIDRQVETTSLGLKLSEAQRKNILKTAFSGQLVPQDSNDESTLVLLDKIKAEREALVKIGKPRKPRKPKEKVNVMDTLLEVLTAEDRWIDAQEAFKKCGIVDGISTDRIEEIYTELRKLEKEGKIEIERNNGYDQLKLITQEVKAN